MLFRSGLRLGTAHELQYLRPGKGWNSRAIKDYRSLNETTRKVDYSLLHESFVERVSSSEPVELNLGPTYRDDPFRNVPVTFPMGVVLDSSGNSSQSQQSSGQSADVTVRSTHGGSIVRSTGGNRTEAPSLMMASSAKKCPKVKRIEDIPSRFWKIVPNKVDGTQYYSTCWIGAKGANFKQVTMLDGGSGVNSVPEDVLIKIINDHADIGIGFGHKIGRAHV